jgi:SAM-dependent methyltransferase
MLSPRNRTTRPDFKQLLATSVATTLARENKDKEYSNDANELMKNPFLRFHANYSLSHVDLNTPNTYSLATDLASVENLETSKILCLGSRNLDEIFQLRLVGAKAERITAIDLYSDIPEIIAMDFQDLKFEDNSFDVIFWAGSYAYAEDPMLALSEAFRVLKPSGIFALGDTYLGEMTREKYNDTHSQYISGSMQDALDELPDGTTLTKGISSLGEIQERLKNFDIEKVLLARDYVVSPHYNIIVKSASL